MAFTVGVPECMRVLMNIIYFEAPLATIVSLRGQTGVGTRARRLIPATRIAAEEW